MREKRQYLLLAFGENTLVFKPNIVLKPNMAFVKCINMGFFSVEIYKNVHLHGLKISDTYTNTNSNYNPKRIDFICVGSSYNPPYA